ncbi:TetR/AcrR family transcriptional regulator [Clostridiales bacterium]|jgi:AcrR family transcriptional regulator|nr:TetR/AcrR family transcriptional regulator [Clostridiales bacterium]
MIRRAILKEKRLDRRVRKTRHQLRQGLAKLMLQKSVKEITVKELTELVDINRGTFYLHYKDIYDMAEKIQLDIIEEFQQIFAAKPDYAVAESPFSLFVEIYTYLAENADLCAAFLGKNGDMAFVEKLKSMVQGRCLHSLKAKYENADPDQFEWFSAFVVGGHLGLIQKWLDTGMREDPEEMATLAVQMVMSGVRFLESSKDTCFSQKNAL